MNSGLHNIIFSKLNLSKEQVLDEVALLSAYQQKSELDMEIEYFEKKYKTTFEAFNKQMISLTADLEKESDWLSWKFAVDGKEYWTNLLNEVQK